MPSRPVLPAAILVVLMTPAAAYAQAPQVDPRARGPYRGLFGGNALDPNSRQSLDATFSLFGGYDDDVSNTTDPGTGGGGGGVGPGDPLAQASSSFFGGGTRLRYQRQVVDRVTFLAGGGLSSSYYPDIDDIWATSYYADAALGWSINPRTRLNLSQTFRFSPFYSYSILPLPGVPDAVELPPVPGFDTRVVRQDNYNYDTSLTFSRETTQRSTLSATAQYYRTDFAQGGDYDYQDSQNWSAGGRWSYRVSKSASARLGYTYRTGNYAVRSTEDVPAADLTVHDIDVGVDYGRALSFSRSTKFSFSTGTVAYQAVGPGIPEDQQGFRFTFLGNARLSHEIGRSWLAALTYQRDLQLVNGFSAPFLTDAITGLLGGFLNDRSRLAFYGGVNWGDYGYGHPTGDGGTDDRRTRTIYFTPSFQFALTSYLAVDASYFYYWYKFDEGAAPLPEGFLPRYDRQGFRVGLSAWVPLLR
jgi:hypothetical protein